MGVGLSMSNDSCGVLSACTWKKSEKNMTGMRRKRSAFGLVLACVFTAAHLRLVAEWTFCLSVAAAAYAVVSVSN
jgi:hypothetical protein